MPRLNRELMDRTPYAESGQITLRDDRLPGFMAVIGKKTKTFTMAVEIWEDGKRRTRKRKLGTYPDLSADEARRAARALAEELRCEETQPEASATEETGPVTFAAAWASLRARVEKDVAEGHMSPVTLANYDRSYDRLSSLHSAPLRGIKRDLVAAFDAIRDTRGPTAAHASVVFFGIVYNHALEFDLEEDLPANPTAALKRTMRRVKPKKDNLSLSAAELPEWEKKRRAIPNAVRAEFHLLNLLTGSRPGALSKLRWEDVDLEAGEVRFREVKGITQNEDKAYTLPITDPMRESFERLAELRAMKDRNNPWVFPGDADRSHTDGFAGHLVNWKEEGMLTGKYLRKTAATLAAEACVSGDAVKLFMNHSDQSVTDRYRIRSKMDPEWFRREMDLLNNYISASVRGGEK